MSVFALAPNENWICDRFEYEWSTNNAQFYTSDIEESDLIWLMAPWQWKTIPHDKLCEKIVVATIHHLVISKLSKDKLEDFNDRDQLVDFYHVPCEKTKKQLSNFTNKPIEVIPF